MRVSTNIKSYSINMLYYNRKKDRRGHSAGFTIDLSTAAPEVLIHGRELWLDRCDDSPREKYRYDRPTERALPADEFTALQQVRRIERGKRFDKAALEERARRRRRFVLFGGPARDLAPQGS